MMHSRVKIRNTNPGLYHAVMTLCLMQIALALNFWTSHPTFNPLGVHKDIVGLVFFGLGFVQLLFLNVLRDLRKVRLALAVSIAVMFFWGLLNTEQFFAGKASLQLPILYVSLSVIQTIRLIEAPVNPMTERES